MIKFLFIILLCVSTFNIYAQDSKKDQNKKNDQSISDEDIKKAIEKGGWLISKTEPDFEKIGNLLAFLLSNNISPEAIDRNIVGELLVISQLSPPASPVYRFQLGVYETETEMMEDMETLAKDLYIPTAMDVQDDAAFVLYVLSDKVLTGVRLVKIKSIDEMQKSINLYYGLGFLPAAISTFQDTLWILFASYLETDILKSDILIKIIEKDSTNKILTETLADTNNSLIDVSFTIDDKVILLFHKNLDTETKEKKNDE